MHRSLVVEAESGIVQDCGQGPQPRGAYQTWEVGLGPEVLAEHGAAICFCWLDEHLPCNASGTELTRAALAWAFYY